MPSERRRDDAPGAGQAASPPPSPSGSRRLARRASRALIALVVVALALVALALAVLQTDWGRERVRRFALDRLRGALRGEVDVARLGGDLLRGITLHDVAIRGPDGAPFLAVDRLEVRYDVRGFLRREILLGEVVLEQPRIVLLQDSSGDWNLRRILPEPDPRQPPSPWGAVVRVGHLEIRDGSVLVTSRASPRAFGPLGDRLDVRFVNGGLELDVDRAADELRRLSAEDLSFELTNAGLAVRELDAAVESTRDGIEIEHLRVRTPASRLALRGRMRDPAQPVLDLTLRADPLAFVDVRPFSARAPATGTLHGGLRLEGPADSLTAHVQDVALRTERSLARADGRLLLAAAPRFEGQLELAPLHPEDARAAHPAYPLAQPLAARMEASGSPERTEVEAELAFGATRARVHGTVGRREAATVYDLRAEVSDLNLQDLLREPEWASVVNGTAHVRGRGRAADLVVALRDSRLRGYRIRSASLEGALRGETLLVNDLRVALPGSAARAAERVQLGGGVDLTFQATARDLADVLPRGPRATAAAFVANGRVSGAPGSLRVEVSARGDSLRIAGAVIDSLGLTANLTGVGGPRLTGTVEAVARDVLAPGGPQLQRVELDARFAGGAGDLVVSLRADSVRSATAHALVQTRPVTTVVVDSLALAAGERVWRMRGGGRVTYAAGALRFDDATLAREDRHIALTGTLDLDGRFDVRLGIEAAPLAELQEVAGLDPVLLGTLTGSATLAGTAAAPVLDSELELLDLRAGDHALRRAGGTVSYEDERLTVDLEALPVVAVASDSAAAGRLVVRGTLPVDLALRGAGPRFPDAPLDLVLESAGLRLTAVQPDSTLAGVGVLDAELRVTGRTSSPSIAGSFDLGASRVGGVALQRLRGTLRYEARELAVEAELVPGELQSLSSEPEDVPAAAEAPGVLLVRARVPVELSLSAGAPRLVEQPAEVAVQGRGLTLGLLEAVVPAVTQASGPIEVDVRVTGTPAVPRWQGRIVARDGAFRTTAGVAYSGVNGALRFDNDELVVEELRVGSATGEAAARGRVELADLVPGALDVQLTARRFTLIDDGDRELVVDAALDVGGTAEAPVLTGELNVEHLEWPLPERSDKDVIRLDEAIFYVRAEGDTTTTAPAPGLWQQTRMDVDVTIEDDAVLRSEKALIVLRGDLSLRKEVGARQPSVAGALDVVRGTYSDFGRTFEVSQGAVRFFGTPDLNASLDVSATTTVTNEDDGGEVDVTLDLAGTLEQPELDLASTPAFDRSEILSLLLFGTPDPSAGQEARFRSTVSRVAASRAAAPLSAALANEIGLDVFEIQPGVGAGGGGFRAGKYVATDVFVTYTQTTGSETNQGLGVEYRLSDQWSLQTHAGTRQFGVDVLYEFRY